MTKQIVIVGAGGFGRETLDVLRDINEAHTVARFELIGVLDDSPSEVNLTRLRKRNVAWLGPVDQWLRQPSTALFVVAIGSPSIRRAVVVDLVAAGRTAATLVHPRAIVGSEAVIGEGAVVCGGVHVSTNVRIGRHTHVNPNATIGHDSTVGSFVSVNPAATISGDVTVEDETLIGAGAVILQGLRVSTRATVGAGACVVRDVPEGTTVKGVPAR